MMMNMCAKVIHTTPGKSKRLCFIVPLNYVNNATIIFTYVHIKHYTIHKSIISFNFYYVMHISITQYLFLSIRYSKASQQIIFFRLKFKHSNLYQTKKIAYQI
ncbi:hypothetical protein QTP88_005145 [Uroleucon formosanum]